MNPKARIDDLLVNEMEDELLMYTLDDDRAHGLNPVAALVFKACDGSNTVPEIAQALHEALDVPRNETLALTALTLDRLTEAGLLEPGYAGAEPTRRELLTRLRRLAAASAALMPAVWSLTAPPPTMAQSACRAACLPGEFDCTRICNCSDGHVTTISDCTNVDLSTPVLGSICTLSCQDPITFTPDSDATGFVTCVECN